MYRSLDANRIIETARVLVRRVTERFPDSGLSKVAQELHGEASRAALTCRRLAVPMRWVRLLAGGTILAMVAAAIATFFALNREVELFSSVADFMQGLDAAVNELILFGAAAYFLFNLETRLKRARALKGIHVLRSMAHIIDMHQLTKDPELMSGHGVVTPSSPQRKMTPFELTRYLDYCSEMLSLLSKIGALYVQDFSDPVTLSAVDEVQDLTTGLSQKMWQKIMILQRLIAPK